MNLFRKINQNKSVIHDVFNKNYVMQEILDKREENCPGWNLFRIFNGDDGFNKIYGDFLAIYTSIINEEIRITSNPYSDYKNIVKKTYQIVREVYITDQFDDNEDNNIYKKITAKSAKELFLKLKKEQE